MSVKTKSLTHFDRQPVQKSIPVQIILDNSVSSVVIDGLACLVLLVPQNFKQILSCSMLADGIEKAWDEYTH